MSPLEAAFLVLALFLPATWLVRREIDRIEDPRYLRDHGVVIVAESVLQAHSAPIGTYRGHPIWGTVTFMGMPYRFDRVALPKERERIGRGEMYLEPGLIYVTD